MGGGSRGIRRVSLFETYNSVVARVLGQAYGKTNEAVGTNKPLDMSGGKKRLVSPLEGKSSEKYWLYSIHSYLWEERAHALE